METELKERKDILTESFLIIEYDNENYKYLVTKAKPCDCSSNIVSENEELESRVFLFEYGQS